VWNGGNALRVGAITEDGKKRAGASPRGVSVTTSKEDKRVPTGVVEARFFRADRAGLPDIPTRN